MVNGFYVIKFENEIEGLFMGKRKTPEENEFSGTNLRESAKKNKELYPELSEEMKKKPLDELYEELHIHQIELEMQNEELKKTHIDLEESRDKYLNLYDFAPVGYFTFTHQFLIADINLSGASLLGIERHKLINHGFRQFVFPDNLDTWDKHIRNVLTRNENRHANF